LVSQLIKLSSLDEANSFIEQNPLAFLFISRTDCGVCHALLPQVEKLLESDHRIALGSIDAEEVKEIAGRFSVFSVPALLFFVEGKEYFREAGIVHMDLLKEKIGKISRLYEG